MHYAEKAWNACRDHHPWCSIAEYETGLIALVLGFDQLDNYSDNIPDHQLQIDADAYLPVDENLIPTGICKPVTNTPFDFRQFRPIVWQEKPFGYDHNFCLADCRTDSRPVARLRSLKSGLQMTVITTEPGLQVFDGQSTLTEIPGHSGKPYKKHAGIALEPQCWPDAPNHKQFPDIVLKAGDQYRQLTIFKFQ